LYVAAPAGSTKANILLNGFTGIGTGSDQDRGLQNLDDATTPAAYLVVQDYIKLVHDNTVIAHLRGVINNNTPTDIQFYPNTNAKG